MTRLHAVADPSPTYHTGLQTWASGERAREANAPLDFADIGQNTNIFGNADNISSKYCY